MEDDIDWQKLAYYLEGECSKEERKEIESWIEADPLRREFVSSLRVMWEAAGGKQAEWDVEAAWNNVVRRSGIEPLDVQMKSRSMRRREAVWGLRHWSERSVGQYLRVALALLFLVGVPYLVFQFVVVPPEATDRAVMREVATEKGERAKVKLTDGTTILLNAASIIRFPEKFAPGVRELHLQGEAYFDVKSIEGMPFIVRADEALIEVLGTKFNVSVWPEENHVRVVVADGKVAFRSRQGDTPQQVVLVKGQMSNLTEDGTLTPPKNVDLDKQLDWVSGRLVFDNSSLREVLRRLERRHNFICTVSDSSLLSRHLTASFKDESLQDILKIIGLTLDLQFRRSDGTVVFYSAKPSGARKRK